MACKRLISSSFIISDIKVCQGLGRPQQNQRQGQRLYSSPSSSGLQLEEIADKILKEKQSIVEKEIHQLQNEVLTATNIATRKELEFKLQRKKIELGHMFPYKNDIERPYARETYAYMSRRNFLEKEIPKLLKHATKYKIFEDAFPEPITPIDNLRIKFYFTRKWKTCWGHGIPSNFAHYSPSIIITPMTVDDDALYTLMMVDLDRENLATKSYQEWCHWLITNIPINTSQFVIAGGLSPFLNPLPTDNKRLASPSSEKYHHNIRFQPVEEYKSCFRKLGGDVIFPYVPPHPANSEPGREHRYLFTLMKQPNGQRININIEDLKAKADEMRKIEMRRKKAWERMVEGDGERRILARERACLGRTWQFKMKHNLQITGYGFLRCRWSTLTSQVFSRLGLHEPVFGRLPPESDLSPALLERIKTATELATVIDKNPGTLDISSLKQLNLGLIQHVPKQRLATQRDKTVARLEKEYEAALTKRAKNEGKTLAEAKAELEAWKSNFKLHRLSVVAAAGMVRAREGIKGGNAERIKFNPKYALV